MSYQLTEAEQNLFKIRNGMIQDIYKSIEVSGFKARSVKQPNEPVISTDFTRLEIELISEIQDQYDSRPCIYFKITSPPYVNREILVSIDPDDEQVIEVILEEK
ncbi:hypothetical protein QEH52_05070 [Coraliomargarita sp. SDUM461003]|uniref:Uncharacterized protein n=1 Tax=Thalassobacterium maritimum TaxID=3041265 RepID=A0ABU1AS42_9BACT|nr:hypothetical protein [Coraliomargarita sp. SDUM461003]MDQ8206868.1 hypothetical protein [Coraliomargarita sp. SDUM461003]